MNFGKALKTIRLIRDMTQEESVSRLNMDVRTLREIEAGRTNVTAEQIVHFSEIYTIDVKIIYELASGQTTFSNVVHVAKRDGIVNYYAQQPLDNTEVLTISKGIIERLSSLEKHSGNLSPS